MDLVVRKNVKLSAYTTLKTGGDAQYFTTAKTTEDVIKAVTFAEQKALPLFVLGGGSNVMVSDAGYRGLVVKIEIEEKVFLDIDDDKVRLTVGAGEVLDDVISEVADLGYWGLENLSYIPGTVGATPVQNVGAYGVEVSDVIESVTVLNTETKKIEILKNVDCKFSYRDSIFKSVIGKKFIILSVIFILTKKTNPKLNYADLCKKFISINPTPQSVREEVINIRKGKFPDWKLVGTAGSFFKNPIIDKALADKFQEQFPDLPVYNMTNNKVKVSLGFILDKVCLLRGYTKGNVGLYEKQALVLVTNNHATTTEIISFADFISQEVFKKTEIKISMEVTTI